MSSLRSRAPISSSSVVRRVMQANTGRETGPERIVRGFLHQCGLRFQNDRRPIPNLRCTADLVFPGARLCLFVDGCFWHGCPVHFRVPDSNSAWWAEKIEANRVRDRRNDAVLARDGWKVIRIWEHQVSGPYLAKLEAIIRKRVQKMRARPVAPKGRR
jgi:DNA mismatch endonuclease (patch repair protein)